MQESPLVAHAYERREHESVRARGEIGERQHCPGPELPAPMWRVLLARLGDRSEHGHLRGARRRVECHLVLSVGGKVTGQAPGFLVPVFATKDKIPVVVLDVAIMADVRLKVDCLLSIWLRSQGRLSYPGKPP